MGKTLKLSLTHFYVLNVICHDVCEPDALTLSSSFNIKEFFEPKAQNLIHFTVRRCNECNSVFSTNSDDELCHRCKI